MASHSVLVTSPPMDIDRPCPQERTPPTTLHISHIQVSLLATSPRAKPTILIQATVPVPAPLLMVLPAMGRKITHAVSSSLNQPISQLTALPVIRFKPSPFYRVDQPLNPLVLCQGESDCWCCHTKLIPSCKPENKDGSERRSQNFTFNLTAEQSEKLQT